MILTLSEARTAFGSSSLSDEALLDVVAGFSRQLESRCNRVFASRASGATQSGSDVITFLLTQHGLSVGSDISVRSSTGDSNLDGVHAVTAVTRDTVAISSSVAQATLDLIDDITIRPVRTNTYLTRVWPSLFIDPRPVESIVSIQRASAAIDGDYTTLVATTYVLADQRKDGLSYSGEIALIDGTNWPGPVSKGRVLRPAGAIVEFVAGEPFVPPDAIYCVERALQEYKNRKGKSAFQSESNEDYSYSKMSGGEADQFFGEVESTIAQLTLPAV